MEVGSTTRLSELPPGFCVMPFTGMQVATTGELRPCCLYEDALGDVRTGIVEAWESAEWADLRDRFLRGEPVPGCWKCVEEERRGGHSLRQERSEYEHLVVRRAGVSTATPDEVVVTADSRPRLLDLRFSNRCNLKCRTCWHGASSRWYADARALGLPVGPVAEIESFAPGTVLQELAPLLPSVEMIYFAGGEPLLAPDHGSLLRHLIDIGRHDITLEYNSNMMVRDVESWDVFDLWEQFAHVRVEASIDGVGDVGALVRSGFDWSTFVHNVDELRRRVPSVALRFGITVSALNVAHLPELVRTLQARWPDVSLHVHAVSSPSHYRLGVLPVPAREVANDSGRSPRRSTSAAANPPSP